MTRVGASLGLAILIGWLVFAVTGWALSPPLRAGLGLVVGGALVFGLRRNVVVGGAMALLAPFGVMLPLLAMRHMAVKLGVDLPGFAKWELALFLLAYTAFLLSAFGLTRFDIYRLGYAPGPVMAMSFAVCAFGAVTGNWLLALAAVLGQLFWALKWGSSNWFDHMLHVLLWPVALIVLIFG